MGSHRRDQDDAFSRTGAAADQRRVGSFIEIFEPDLEALELTGDPEFRVDRIRIHPGFTRGLDELG